MGDFTEHVLFGFLTAAMVSYFLKQNIALGAPEAFASSLAIVVGSVLPDIDHKNAYVHRAVKAFASIGAGVFAVVFLPFQIQHNFVVAAAAFLVVYIGFSAIKMEHRGFTHSLSFMAIVSSLAVISSVLLLSSPAPGVAAGLGVLSHLVLDQEFKLV
ncbi:MAG: metal-dependent hydrolase, partial [Candidatus Nanosalina sp.]